MSYHRRGPWSQSEDSYLVELVRTQGALNWVRIAQLIGNRSPKQCRERYHQNLKPSLNHEPISPEEGLQIERMVGELGKRWGEIASRLNGRSDLAVKNWWNGSMNRRKRLLLQGTPRDIYTVSPATGNMNHNTQNAITAPSDYSTTHLPAQWPPNNRWGARVHAGMDEISGELSASTSNNGPPKFLNTTLAQISLHPMRQYPRDPWNGPHMPVDVNDEAPAESREDLRDNFTDFSKDSGYKSAKSMPNSNAPTSKGLQPVSWNARNVINDNQSLGAGHAEEAPRKALSDTSHNSGFSGTTLSGLDETKVKGAPQELAEILANHPELRPLILQATKEMDPRRFDKVFIRLLKACAIDLRGEAKTQLEKGAVRIIYNYRAYATSLIRDEFTSRGHEKVSAMHSLKFQKVEDKINLEILMQNYCQQKSAEKQELQMNEDDEEDDKLSMGSDYDDPDEPDLRNLRKVRVFITSSTAFSNLKSNLEDFLIATLDGNKPVIATLQASMEDIQWHPATADRRSSTKRKSAENEEEISRQLKWPRLDNSNEEKYPFAFFRPYNSSVDIDVNMKDLDIEHEVKRQPQEIGNSNANDHYSSSKHSGSTSIPYDGLDPPYHQQPSELLVLTTSNHISLEQDTSDELNDMHVLDTPTLIASRGKGKPAFVYDVNKENARVLQRNTQSGSSSTGGQNLNIHRPPLAVEYLSHTEDENCSFQGIALRDPVKPIIDGQLIQQRPSSSTTQKMWGLLKRRWRPSLRPGHRRLEWVCGCGDSLYADLQDDGGPTLAMLSANLTCHTAATPPSNSNSQAQSLTPMRPIHYSSFSIPKAHNSQHSPARSLLDQSNLNHINHALLQPPLNSTPPKSPQFLELCVNIGEYLKVLGEIPTCNISNDQELFQSIKKKYMELRGFRARFWLLKPAAVNYVYISVESCHRVGILEKPLALPPKIEVDAKRYIYDPCPLVGGVPIPDHIFLHYMDCPNPSSKDAWLGRLPKKLDTSITHNAPAVTYGWGVHIDEGPNYGAIAWTNFFVLLLSGAAAALWNFYRKDFQGAFGFSCWIIAVLNSLMIGYFFRWKNE